MEQLERTHGREAADALADRIEQEHEELARERNGEAAQASQSGEGMAMPELEPEKGITFLKP